MGKISTFEIFVNNTDGGPVKAGDTFSGEVFLELSEDIEVNEVRVTFTGKAHVHWAEAQKSAPMAEIQSSVVDPVVAEETYVTSSVPLYPRHARSHRYEPLKVTKLKKGTHSFSFEFTVPDWAPSSFSGSHGYVRYMLKATVERPWKVEVNTRALTVLSELDLNTIPKARDTVDLSDSIKITSLPLFSVGECRANMRLARKGYLPGETIPVELAIHNDSHHELYKVSLQLKMTIKYKSYGKVCTSELVLAKNRLCRVPAGRTFEGFDRKLRVPKICPPTGLPGCTLISVRYLVELRIKPSLLSLKRLKLTTDVIIGTIPLDMTLSESPPDYYSICPPSYEDVLAMTKLEKAGSNESLDSRASLTVAPTTPSTTTTTTTPTPTTASTTTQRQTSYAGPTPESSDVMRMTVLRKNVLLEVEEEDKGLMRPRANTGHTMELHRSRGR